MDKYKQYVDVQWWNGVKKRDIENWIRNFGASEEIAELILDNVIFYTAKQMKSYTLFLVNLLKEQVYLEAMKENGYDFLTDEQLEKKWETYLEQTRFIPAALSNDPTSSAHKILGHWRSSLERGDEFFSVINAIGEDYGKGVHRFVLVDDFSGSGEQMLEVLQQKICFKNQSIELGMLPELYSEIEIVVAVYVLHENAKKNIHLKYPQVKLICVDKIDDRMNYLNEKSSMYRKYSDDKKQAIIEEIQKLNDNIMNENTEFKKLSSYVLNIPIVFEHGCPNNTLLLLFAHSDNWQQLFKRGKEI